MNSAGTKSQVTGFLPRLLICNELRHLTRPDSIPRVHSHSLMGIPSGPYVNMLIGPALLRKKLVQDGMLTRNERSMAPNPPQFFRFQKNQADQRANQHPDWPSTPQFLNGTSMRLEPQWDNHPGRRS